MFIVVINRCVQYSNDGNDRLSPLFFLQVKKYIYIHFPPSPQDTFCWRHSKSGLIIRPYPPKCTPWPRMNVHKREQDNHPYRGNGLTQYTFIPDEGQDVV